MSDLVSEAETYSGLDLRAWGCEWSIRLFPPRYPNATPHAPGASSKGIAEGLPGEGDISSSVLRDRGRADATRTHLIFFEDDGESPSMTFGELFTGAERVAADLVKRGIGRGDRVALMLPTSREFFLTFAGTLLARATPVPIYPPFRADRVAEYAERQSAIL